MKKFKPTIIILTYIAFLERIATSKPRPVQFTSLSADNDDHGIAEGVLIHVPSLEINDVVEKKIGLTDGTYEYITRNGHIVPYDPNNDNQNPLRIISIYGK